MSLMMSPRAARRVLVTGASGLIGSHVLQALIEAGHEPVAFSRRAPPPEAPPVEHVAGDVRDGAALQRAMDGCSGVIHAAGVYSYKRADAAAMMEVNVVGTAQVLTAADRAGAGRVVVTSSSATCGPVAGRPADETDEPPAWELTVPYKRSKLAGERVALARAQAGQDVVVVNPTTTVGAGDHRPTPSGAMVRDVIARRIRGYITSGGLNVVSARDVAQGHVLALERGRAGERYLLGGENLSMTRLFGMIADAAGTPAPRTRIPYSMALAAAAVADGAHRAGLTAEPSLLVLDEVRLARLPMYFSIAKAERELGYSHQPPSQALAPAVAWFVSQRAQARPSTGAAAGRRWTYSSLRAGGDT